MVPAASPRDRRDGRSTTACRDIGQENWGRDLQISSVNAPGGLGSKPGLLIVTTSLNPRG
jgi:hypothetical protein